MEEMNEVMIIGRCEEKEKGRRIEGGYESGGGG